MHPSQPPSSQHAERPDPGDLEHPKSVRPPSGGRRANRSAGGLWSPLRYALTSRSPRPARRAVRTLCATGAGGIQCVEARTATCRDATHICDAIRKPSHPKSETDPPLAKSSSPAEPPFRMQAPIAHTPKGESLEPRSTFSRSSISSGESARPPGKPRHAGPRDHPRRTSRPSAR